MSKYIVISKEDFEAAKAAGVEIKEYRGYMENPKSIIEFIENWFDVKLDTPTRGHSTLSMARAIACEMIEDTTNLSLPEIGYLIYGKANCHANVIYYKRGAKFKHDEKYKEELRTIRKLFYNNGNTGSEAGK